MAGFNLHTAGAVSVNGIAKWNGSVWSALGAGIWPPPGEVRGLAWDGPGNLYAGGRFTTAGGVSCANIAKWDGSAWSALGSGIGDANTSVFALAFDTKGNLYGVGSFTTAGQIPANNIAKWNGSSWSVLGSGVGGYINALACDRSGNLYVGGGFQTAGTNVSFCLAKALLSGPTPNQLLLARAGTGTNVFTYLGAPSASYALDLATSLKPPVNWVPQGTNRASTANAATAGYLTFTNSNRLPQAFYRTRSVP